MSEKDKWIAIFIKIWESRFDQLDVILHKLKNKRQ